MATNINISQNLMIPREDLELKELLGVGSFGAVYKGQWKRKESPVAIKQVRSQEEENLQSLCHELNTMASLSFPFICKVYGGCAVSSNEIWLVLDCLPGGSLHDVLHSSAPLPWTTQLSFAVTATLAVNYLHSRPSPLLHRDIKSHNFLVRNGKDLVLTDFGLSKTKEAISTKTATIGTLNWAAPEILKEEPEWSEKADIYSLGMVFYEIVSREIPFKSTTNLFTLHKKIKGGALPTLPSDCPEVFAKIIQKCWDKDPAHRPTARDLLEKLLELQKQYLTPSPEVLPIPVAHTPPKSFFHSFFKLPSAPLPRSPSTEKFNKEPPASMKRSGSAPSIAEISVLPVPSPIGISPPTSPSSHGRRGLSTSADLLTVSPRSSEVLSPRIPDNSPRPCPEPISPLCKAAASGDIKTLHELVASGIDVNSPEEFGRTPLHLASARGHSAACEELVRLGHADLDVTDEFGETPLHLACECGHAQTVRKLIKLGAHVDGKGAVMRTPLHAASEEGHMEVVRELLRNKAQVEALDDTGNTPIHWASEGGHKDIVQELAAKRANVKVRNHLGLTPLHLAAKKGHTETCRVLVRYGAEVNALCAYLGTPLHLAAERGHCDTAQELIMVGAEVGPVNKLGKTPLQLAMLKGHEEVVKTLYRWCEIIGVPTKPMLENSPKVAKARQFTHHEY